MDQLQDLISGLGVQPVAVVDVLITALLIYGLFSLIRGTRAVRLVIGVTVLYGVYLASQFLGLRLLSNILQTGAVVGLLAVVVVFQPELRRALERIGRFGSLGWLVNPASNAAVERIALQVARAAALMAAERHGALIVIERETGLQDAAEEGVMLHADLDAQLLRTIFTPRTPLHDGAVIIRGERIVAAGVVLPLTELSLQRERYGTRHRAAAGITEQTDALAVVVSEETGSIGLAEHGQIVRPMEEEELRKALVGLLRPAADRRRSVLALASLDAAGLDRRFRLRNVRARRNVARRGAAKTPVVPAPGGPAQRNPSAPVTTPGERG
jgi:diadenylate cyclase